MPVRRNPGDRHQLQQIVAGLTEGVILVDDRQDIVWANQAALAMHGVAALEELGLTVDAYRDRFSLQYRNNHRLSTGDYPIERVIAGEAFRDVVVEVTPPGAGAAQWVHRVRSLILTQPTGEADCLVLILTDVTDRFAAEERFEASFNVNPGPAIIYSLADRLYIRVNDGFLALTGLSRSSIIGRDVSAIDLFADVADRDAALSLSLVAQDRPVTQVEVRLRVPGGCRPVIVAGRPIEIDDKPCMMFTFTDPEPRRIVERALAEARERSQADFEALYTEAPIPMHSLDVEARIVTVSDRWLDLLGYERRQVIGRPITDFLCRESADRFRDTNWPQLLAAGNTRDLEYRFVHRSGALADVLLSARTGFDRDGAFVRTTAVLTDITERKRSEERFAKAFSLAPVPMTLSTLDGFTILDANQAFLAMTGRASAEAIGRSFDQLGIWESRDDRERFERALTLQGSIRHLDAKIRGADGSVSDCLLAAETVNLLGRECALMVFQDISERRRSEAQLFEAIETVMRDTSWFSRSVIEKLANLRHPRDAARSGSALEELTRRERQILEHLSRGHGDEEIGRCLGLSRSTVRNHIAAVYSKIGVHSRSDAIVWARERGVTGTA